MNKEENDNHILIEVLNKNGDLRLTKFRNPRVIFQNNDYPDEYIFRDVDIVNVFQLLQENQEYKRLGFKHLIDKCNKLENQQKKFVEYLENEKDRLTRECSPTYKYSLGKTRLVNEDIFNEVDTILLKYKEIIEKQEKGE